MKKGQTKGTPALRFDIGRRVQCNLGSQGWATGTIVALHYREDHWPAGKESPYQIELDAKYDSNLIHAPADIPAVIRAEEDDAAGTPSLPQRGDAAKALAALRADIAAARALPFVEKVVDPRPLPVAEHQGDLIKPTDETGPWIVAVWMQHDGLPLRLHLKCNRAWPTSPASAQFCGYIPHVAIESDGLVDEDALSEVEQDLRPSMKSHTLEGTLRAIAKLLSDPGDYMPPGAAPMLRKAKEERERRLDIINTYRAGRRHPRLYAAEQGWEESWFDPGLWASIADGSVETIRAFVTEEATEVYSFPLFTPEFCEMYIEEIYSFYASGLPARRPNSMNNYGVVVNEIGLEPMNDMLQIRILQPIARALFGNIGAHLGHQHTFIVRYKVGEDLGLDMHTDDSDVTFNVCLGKDFSGAGLQFCGNQAESTHRKASKVYHHVKGRCVVHLGHRRHGADDITEGERLNLIIWNHNPEYRRSRLYARHNMQKPSTYEKEQDPPDPVCVSFTHDRDYGIFKPYSAKSLQHKGQGWCPPRHAEYPGFVEEN
mmetsp:Transcript_54422/g.100559  ORF Transcript_54422/g.100559 Transcript_54422/m.100559 type:complete len:543 (-) Transcript_54422:71-1699(-)